MLILDLDRPGAGFIEVSQPNRNELNQAVEKAKAEGKWGNGPGQGIEVTIGWDSEVYHVRDAIWKKLGMEPFGGCLCIGCLEKRLGRKLKPKDFQRHHPFNSAAGTARLLSRQKR
jgi:hypothetical protein